jgi:VPDSG-CTERM motif
MSGIRFRLGIIAAKKLAISRNTRLMTNLNKSSWLRRAGVAVCAGLLALSPIARADTITPSYALGSFIPGTSITYNADHTSGEIHSGDGFTIFDVAGFTGSLGVPAGWVFSGAAPVGSPWGVGPLGPDSAALVNLTFTYTGASIETLALTPFLGFVVGTTATTLVVDDWTSRDHLIGTIGVIDGAVASPHRDTIVVPAFPVVPDGGLTLSLLGFALVGLASLRRKLNRSR